MSRDYKGNERRRSGRGKGSSLLTGILIGLILGLAVALGVAWYINKMPSPFSSRTTQPSKAESPKAPPSQTAKIEEKAAKTEDGKPRFDFYKILPGAEEAAPEKAPKPLQKGSTGGVNEAFFLQAGREVDGFFRSALTILCVLLLSRLDALRPLPAAVDERNISAGYRGSVGDDVRVLLRGSSRRKENQE